MTPSDSNSRFDADESAALHALGWHPSAGNAACPDPALLIAAEEGVLDDAALGARIRAHAESCRTCRVLVTDLAAVLDSDLGADERERIAARVRSGRAAQPRGRPLWWVAPVGLAATAAVVALMFVPWGGLTRVTPLDLPVGDAGAARNTSATPSVFTSGRPVIPRPEPELTLRGEASPVPLAERIHHALDDVDAGRLAQALPVLHAIAQRDPSSADAHLALGAALLRANRNEQARSVLEQARAGKGAASADEIEWFLAVAMVRANDPAAAIAILEPLCARKTVRGAMACAGLTEIRKQQ